MVHEPEKGQETRIFRQEIDPHKDIKNIRDPTLIPNKKGDGASLEHQEESLLPPSQQNRTRKEYGFRLLDPSTKSMAQDWQWLSSSEARDHVIRQSMSNGQFIIERAEREVQLGEVRTV